MLPKGKLPSVLKSDATASVMGYTLELLAVADLNIRCVHTGGFAYLNPAPFTAHDAFVKTSDGWRTIQVKAAQAYRGVRGAMGLHTRRGKKHIKSEILALVDLDHLLIRYVGMSTPLPSEFPKGVAALCRYSSSTADLAIPPLNVGSTTPNSTPEISAKSVVNSSTFLSHGLHGSRSVSTARAADDEHPTHATEAPAAVPILSHSPESGVE